MKNPDSSTKIWDTTQVYVLAIKQARKPVISPLLISWDADSVVSLELMLHIDIQRMWISPGIRPKEMKLTDYADNCLHIQGNYQHVCMIPSPGRLPHQWYTRPAVSKHRGKQACHIFERFVSFVSSQASGGQVCTYIQT